VPPAQAEPAIVAIDKLDKIGPNGVERELRERGLEPGVVADLTNALTSVPAANSEILCWLERQVDGEAGVAAVADLRTILRYCAGGPTAERLRIDPFLARGLSYYTGAIFEVAFPELNASGGGGGRYDELLGMFTGQPVPACGFSLGLERIILIMSERKMFPEQLGRRPQALVTQYDDSTIGASLALARQLRASGLRVDVYPDIKGYGAQFKYAQRRGIRYALLIGPSERDAGSVSVRDLETGEQSAVEESRVLAWLEARLSTT
jgi:histidyl-tRNA synthetase